MKKVKCPVCRDKGQHSKVGIIQTRKTLMGFGSYYDEYGDYHSHDPNEIRQDLKCYSCGHEWTDISHPPCPSAKCSYGKYHRLQLQ